MKKLVSLAMLVLLLGGSAATVIPNSTAQPATVAQTVQLSDEQLDGVQGGQPSCTQFGRTGVYWCCEYTGWTEWCWFAWGNGPL